MFILKYERLKEFLKNIGNYTLRLSFNGIKD